METVSMESVVRSVQEGASPDDSLIAWLTQTSMDDFLSEIRSIYAIVFQERQVGRKREVGLARACQVRLRFHLSARSVFPRARMTPLFRDCLFVVAEGGQLTGLSVASRLACRPARDGYALTSGPGHHLFRDLGEWRVKPVARKTTVLTEEALRKYGWRFDTSWLQAASTSTQL